VRASGNEMKRRTTFAPERGWCVFDEEATAADAVERPGGDEPLALHATARQPGERVDRCAPLLILHGV
jgi:hypothetical protein